VSIDEYVDFNQKAFIKKIRLFMKANKLSVRKFAKIAGVPEGSVFRAFYSEVELKRSTLQKFQKTLNTWKPKK
jgi:predicted transcriptional regulator